MKQFIIDQQNKEKDKIGWFNTKNCILGFTISPATELEKSEFGCDFRIYSCQHDYVTNVVRITNNKVYFFDNASYEKEGKIKYLSGLKIKDSWGL